MKYLVTLVLLVVVLAYVCNCQNAAEKRFLAALNQVRTQKDLSALTWSNDLKASARRVAQRCRYTPSYDGYDVLYVKSTNTGGGGDTGDGSGDAGGGGLPGGNTRNLEFANNVRGLNAVRSIFQTSPGGTGNVGGTFDNLGKSEYTQVGCAAASCSTITGSGEDFPINNGYLVVCAYG
ncbi:hypothetical protein ABK040_007293 [Willaertia magna]